MSSRISCRYAVGILLGAITACTVPVPPPVRIEPSPGLQAVAQTVSDVRVQDPGRIAACDVSILFSGEVTHTANAIAAVRLSGAVDDTGRILTLAQRNRSPRTLLVPPGHGVMVGTLPLEGIARQARSIRYIEGEVDLSLIGNASTMSFTNLPQGAGKPLEDPRLTRLGIRVVLVTAATYPAVRAVFPSETPITDFVNQAVFFISDPSNRLRSLSLVEPSGRKVTQMRSTSITGHGAMLLPLDIAQPLTDAARLTLEVYLPELTKTYNFRLENVSLP